MCAPRCLGFQFHYGTIKSSKRKETSNCILINFNSTMVRLKGNWTSISEKESFHFNSTMVRLKDCRLIIRMTNYNNFNSTMVRLKAGRTHEVHRPRRFQFHYGTIKRISCIWKCSIIDLISIPLWYD